MMLMMFSYSSGAIMETKLGTDVTSSANDIIIYCAFKAKKYFVHY